MFQHVKTIGLAGGLLLVTACATTLEPDGRLDSARERVEAASAFGTSSSAYTTAAGFLSDAEAAFESGDADEYDKTVELGDAYAQIAIAQGETGEALAAAESMRVDLDAAEAAASQCSADLAECRAAFASVEGNRTATLDLLSGAMRCTKTDRSDGAIVMTCPNLSFGFDTATLNAATDARLTALAVFLSMDSATRVDLIGHTDATGPESWNQALSVKRAETASTFLQNEGVSSARITTSGQGESSPVASNDTRQGRAQNRRVDVVLHNMTDDGMSMASEGL